MSLDWIPCGCPDGVKKLAGMGPAELPCCGAKAAGCPGTFRGV